MPAVPVSAPVPSAAATLPWGQTLLVALIIAVAVLLAGLIVILARAKAPRSDAGGSVVRSWIAVSLVLGLVLFTAFAFAVDDTALRSTLVGGLAASVGSAVSFYFSAKSSDQARQDLLSAAIGTELVPDLEGMTEATATATLGLTSLKLEREPTSSPDPAAKADNQDPSAGTMSPKGTAVRVHFSA